MATFQDKSSGLQFVFSDNWTDVIQFDEHPDVKKYAKGLSCIDFVGMFSTEKLVLIEAKNFKNRPPEQHRSIFERLGSSGGSPLAEEVAGNMKDFVVFVSHVCQKADVSAYETWNKFHKYLLQKEIVSVLWMESDNTQYTGVGGKRIFAAKGIVSDFLQKKLAWLAGARNVFVANEVNQLTNPFGDNLKVSFL